MIGLVIEDARLAGLQARLRHPAHLIERQCDARLFLIEKRMEDLALGIFMHIDDRHAIPGLKSLFHAHDILVQSLTAHDLSPNSLALCSEVKPRAARVNRRNGSAPILQQERAACARTRIVVPDHPA